MDQNQLKLTIGGITVAINWTDRQREFEIPPPYQPFVGNGKAVLRLELHMGFPDCRIGEIVFDSAPAWSLHRNGEDSSIKIYHDYPDIERLITLPHPCATIEGKAACMAHHGPINPPLSARSKSPSSRFSSRAGGVPVG